MDFCVLQLLRKTKRFLYMLIIMFKEILLSTGVSIVTTLSISEIFKEACIHGLDGLFFKYLSNWKTFFYH